MSAQLIDGNALSNLLRTQVAERVSHLQSKGVKAGLAVVLVGDNPASQVYVRNKVKACEDNGHSGKCVYYEPACLVVAGHCQSCVDPLGLLRYLATFSRVDQNLRISIRRRRLSL